MGFYAGLGWQAIAVAEDGGRVLLLSQAAVANKPYHLPIEDITWEGCRLRQWLNQGFFASLPERLRSQVVETMIENPDNPHYQTPGGNPTSDRVFLLSLAEVEEYLPNRADRVIAYPGSDGWWLRTPGNLARNTAFVANNGAIRDLGCGIGRYVRAVRPALWVIA